MSKPVISGNPQSILVTAAIVKYKGVNVGLVSGVKVTVKSLATGVMTDQAGKSKVNDFDVGNDIAVEVSFDEYTAAKMSIAYPQADYISSGGASRITWGKAIGTDYYSQAGILEVIPTSDDTAYFGRHFLFYKAAPIGDSAFQYGPDKKIVIKTNFHCYPDFSKPDGEFFGYFGDIAAGTLVPATGGPAVAGVGNVGNGTVGSIGVNDTFTLTETWSLACISTSGGGIFSVAGSVTGARGNATVGSSYVSNTIVPGNSEIIFLITAGVTPFAVGDSFTIPTTAANYV